MPQPDPTLVAFDDVVVDLAGHRVLRAGVEQTLEPKAFAVLALLAQAPGRVFSRDELMDAVWGHRHVTPGVLNRVMTLVRHALGEEAHDARYLHTLHGVGYRFDLPTPDLDAAPGPPLAEPILVVPATTRPSPTRPRRLLWLVPLIAVLLIAGWRLWPRAQTVQHAPAERSIAVLPLANASGNAGQQFFSDGLTVNLIDGLSKYDELKVIAPASAFQFRDSKDDSTTIGSKLGVAYLLDGSVQHAGGTVRITLTLTKASDGSTLWSQHYDRPYKDLFAIQDEITLAVVGALQVKLLHANAGAVEAGRPASGSLDAYDAFLRGTYAMTRDPGQAIDQFARATQLDPGYAQAWQWLAFVRSINARNRTDSTSAFRAECALAHREAETALSIAPNYGHGYSTLGVQLSSCDFDWAGASTQFQKAMQLVSETDPAHCGYSRLLATLGRLNQALDERRKCVTGDPLDLGPNYYQFQMQASVGQLEDAEETIRNVVGLKPEDAPWYAEELSYLAILRGDAATAMAQAMHSPDNGTRDRAMALALQIGSDPEQADRALGHLIDTQADKKDKAFFIARIYGLRGDAAKAFEWLNLDWERNGFAVYNVLYEPLLLRFRDDPRFTAYCNKVGLPAPGTSEALSIDQIRAQQVAKR